MKAAVLVDKRKIEFQDKSKPIIGSEQVLIKVKYCGICGSDLHAYETGTLYPLGTVIGHEFSGVIAEVGEDVESFKSGDRVAAKPSASCLHCYWCKKGQYSLCPNRRETIIGITLENDGAFSEYVKIRYPEQMLFKLPSSVSFEQAALAEPLSVGFHAVRLSHLEAGESAMVIGAGAIGLGVLQRAKAGGAGKIIVLEVSEKKQHVALKLGADMVLNPKSESGNFRDHILSLTDGIGPDVVFECAGVPAAFQIAMESVKNGGQILLIGLHEGKIPFDAFALLHREVELKGVLGSYDEFRDVVNYLGERKVDTDAMISDIIPLEDLIVGGFERLEKDRDIIKLLVAINP